MQRILRAVNRPHHFPVNRYHKPYSKMAQLVADAELQQFLDETNATYEKVHLAFEKQCEKGGG